MKKDALGNDIVIGQVYGYSRNSNGFTTSTVGELVRETAKGVTLKVLRQTRALYDDDPAVLPIEKSTVNCKASGLFPIDPAWLIPKYDPKYGDSRVCKCGHPYYRHFDSYEDNAPVGCKYCHGDCLTFREPTEELERARAWRAEHEAHVARIVATSEVDAYPPSREDLGNPQVWKPSHWHWFVMYEDDK